MTNVDSTPRIDPSQPKVSVITLFHQRRGLARDFLSACARQQTAGLGGVEWILGDSGSTDGTRELVAETAGDWAHVELFEENVGFARGNNALVARARGEILVFLNYDTGFAPGWLEELVRPFTGRPQLGIVGNVQLSVRSQQPDHAGIFFDAEGSPYHFRPTLAQLARLDLLPVPAVTGACLAIRRDLFEAIGGFHEGYHTSYEDIELCIQARRRGAEVAVATRSVIWHYIGASPGRQQHEDANARLFCSRLGNEARDLAQFVPPELAPATMPIGTADGVRRDAETLQVYFDCGNGFSETASTVFLFRRGRWNRIEVPLPASMHGVVRQIRLDPGRSPGRFKFGGVAAKIGAGRVTHASVRGRHLAPLAEIAGSARRIDDPRGLAVESTGDDPQVTFDLRRLFPGMPDGIVFEVWLWSDPAHVWPPTATKPDQSKRTWRDVFTRRRVLADLTRLSPGGLNGGVKVFVLELLEAIARRHRFRLEVYVIATPTVCREIAEAAPSVTPHPTRGADSPEAAALANNVHVLYAPLGFSALSRPNLPQVSLLVDFLHRDIADALPDAEVAAREKWMIETLACSRVIQCNSQFVVDRLHHHYGQPAADVLVVYNAVGQARTATRDAVAARPYFLYPANDWPHKNHGRLIDAYARYRRESREPWDLMLSGHFADLDRITRSIRQREVSAGVTVLGHVPGTAFSRIFQGASALVFPSRYEGFGIPVLEAFRLGVPVICSRTASLPEVGGEACGYFDPDDPESIAAAMLRISSDTAWRTALMEVGRGRAGMFCLETEAGKLAQVFLDLARSR